MDTEAEAIADLARAQAPFERLTSDETPPGVDLTSINEDGTEVPVLIDARQALGYPLARPSGTIEVLDAMSFVEAVNQRRFDDVTPTLYADESTRSIVAILNDDHGGHGEHRAVIGHRDYRVVQKLQRTPEWDRWRALDDKLGSQEEFADHIERSVRDIDDPDHATMLELAQTFQATTEARFQQRGDLRTGARTIGYAEDVQASAGREGNLEIPERMRLGIQPFFGSVARSGDGWVPARFPVDALVKFRLRDANLYIGYRLVDPDEVERHAWRQIAEQIAEQLGVVMLAAPAPAPVTAPAPITLTVAHQ